MSAARQPVLMAATAGGSATPTHMSVSSNTRALTIPAAVLDLDLTWSARLVLSEVLDLHRVNGNVFALDDHFADRCRVKKRTVGGAIKELEDAGFLQRETNQSARHKRILTPLIDADGKPRPLAKSATGLLQNLPQPIAESATDLLQNLQEAIAESADINTNYSFKVNTNETPQKKEGAGGPEILPSAESQKVVTAPNPVALPPSPALGSVPPCLVAGTDESRALAEEMATNWAIPHGNARRRGQFATFTRTLAAAGRLAEVRAQFDAYRRYQQLRGISRYAIDKYLGHELEGYADGEWCGSEWAQVLAEASQQQAAKPAAYGPPPTVSQATGTPNQRQKNW